MAHLNPTPQEVAGKIDTMREAFNTKFADNIKNGVYDERDLNKLKTNNAYAGCFMRSLKSRGDPNKATEVIHESLKFRKEIGLGDLTPESFPDELTDKKAIYYKGVDVKGHPILYINVKENTAKSDQYTILKQYVAWNFEQHYKDHPEQMCVVLMDMSGASAGNMNLDITKFIISCFTTYFPAFLAYMINYDMPTLLSATWTVISAFLSSEQKQKILVIKKSDIGKYIAPEHQWPHMIKS
jgi:hypothetical protein